MFHRVSFCSCTSLTQIVVRANKDKSKAASLPEDHLTFDCDSSAMVVRMRLYTKDKNKRGTKL